MHVGVWVWRRQVDRFIRLGLEPVDDEAGRLAQGGGVGRVDRVRIGERDPSVAQGSKQGTRLDGVAGQAMSCQCNPEAELGPGKHGVRRVEPRSGPGIERRWPVALLPDCPRGVGVTIVQQSKVAEILCLAWLALRRPVGRAHYQVWWRRIPPRLDVVQASSDPVSSVG